MIVNNVGEVPEKVENEKIRYIIEFYNSPEIAKRSLNIIRKISAH